MFAFVCIILCHYIALLSRLRGGAGAVSDKHSPLLAINFDLRGRGGAVPEKTHPPQIVLNKTNIGPQLSVGKKQQSHKLRVFRRVRSHNMMCWLRDHRKPEFRSQFGTKHIFLSSDMLAPIAQIVCSERLNLIFQRVCLIFRQKEYFIACLHEISDQSSASYDSPTPLHSTGPTLPLRSSNKTLKHLFDAVHKHTCCNQWQILP